MNNVERGYQLPETKEQIGSGVLKHIFILPDNNRTWARENGKTTREAYEIGARRFTEVAHAAAGTNGVENLSIIVLTADNINKRPPEELDEIYDAVRSEVIETGLPALIAAENVRFDVIGRPEMLPETIARDLADLSERSSKNNGLRFSLVFGYDPDQEMRDAMQSAGNGASWDDVKKHLYLEKKGIPPISAVIRAGEERRLSGVFPNSSAGAELLFKKHTPWPEYTADVFRLDAFDLKKRVLKRGA